MLPKPGSKLQWKGLLNPYTYQVWIAIAATLVIATATLGLLLKYPQRRGNADWGLHFLDALHPLCGRNMTTLTANRRRKASLEVFLLTYILCCVVINTSYEGNMKSHLSATVRPAPVKSLQDFRKRAVFRDILTPYPGDVAVVSDLFKKRTELEDIPRRRIRFYEGTSLWDFVYESLDGHALVGSDSFLRESVSRRLTNKFGITKAQIVPESLTSFPISFMHGRMNRFAGHVNRRIGQWLEAGLFEAHWKWEVEKTESGPHREYDEFMADETNNVDPLNLGMFRLLFGMYGAGVIMAGMAFIFEALSFKLIYTSKGHSSHTFAWQS